jgi:wobble nucleotide-excising tRNase
MAITRIKRLRECGIFHDFAWPNGLPDFGRYNLIYGWNGTGKTTLSRLFRCLETRTAPLSGQAAVTVSGNDINNGDFAHVTTPVRVFNRDFVYDTVFPTGGDVAPIFVLGKENIDKQKQVAHLKRLLDDQQTALSTSRQTKITAESALDRFCIDKARGIKDTLRSAGANPYNNYNKGDFRQRADAMNSAGDRDSHSLADSARDTLLIQLRASPKAKLQTVTYQLPNLASLTKAVEELLSTTVVSAVIQSIKNDAAVSSWVHAGLALHQESTGDKCLFCDQPLPMDRLAVLEAHFSTEYEQLLQKLTGQIGTIQAAVIAATNLSLPNASEFYDDLVSDFDAAAGALGATCNSAKRTLELLITELEGKKNRAFEPVAFKATLPNLDANAVANLNSVIRTHNQTCDEFQSRIDSARKQIEADTVAANLDEFVRKRDAINTAEEQFRKATEEVKRLSDEITKLEREIVEHRQPAEELNRDLRNYLGHAELRLEVKDTGYTIMRHNVPAESLSEGETTAIALLYFLKSLQDRRFDLAKGVVLLDDPVSSLDANALYSAFGFIRERTQNAGQLFILTHNFAFFRQVRNWFHHLKGQNKKDIAQRPARFFMLDCVHKLDQRCAGIRWLDRLLEQFESEYHYLFAYIHRTANASPPPALEQNYMLPNLSSFVTADSRITSVTTHSAGTMYRGTIGGSNRRGAATAKLPIWYSKTPTSGHAARAGCHTRELCGLDALEGQPGPEDQDAVRALRARMGLPPHQGVPRGGMAHTNFMLERSRWLL